jgi:hypothetical protein
MASDILTLNAGSLCETSCKIIPGQSSLDRMLIEKTHRTLIHQDQSCIACADSESVTDGTEEFASW